MVFITLLLLSLSLASASHFFGSVVTFTAKSDAHGKYMVEIRSRATYDHGCNHHYATCHRGECGHNVQIEQGQVDNNAVTMTYNSNWCETETIVTKALTSDRPFQIRDHSCCWVWLSPGHTPYWSILTSVDLGRRSDTDKANSSPDTAILPLLRIPQNCRRAYRPLTFDPDGDQFPARPVDPPAPSCVEGEYLPMFVPPTPRHGQVLWAEVGVEVEITVRAEAKYSVVDNLIMSGPLNVSKHRRSGDEFSITYTPQHQNLGQYFSICFAVEFTDRDAVYQTEMRCVLLNVTEGLAQVNTVVTCLESAIIVEVEKATLPQLRYDHLRLSDPSNTVCSLQTHSNSTHVVANVPLNACGTQIQEDDDYLLFKNEITTVDDPSAIITRRHQVEIKFFCQYAKRGNVSLSFSAHRENVTVWDRGFGSFTYGFEFFPDSQFVSRIDPWSYPLEYDVGQRIYMEIQATTTVNNTEMFVESCSAAPYDNPNYHNPYVLIQNGCNVDSTLVVYPSMKEEEFRFSIEAFKFIGLHQKVYIGCSVLMCEAGNPNTRCSRGCLPRGAHRRRRAAAIETGVHYVSQGPVRLRTANTSDLNLNLVFVSGCAVLAVGMICGVLLYRTRQKSSHEYTLLSSEEN
uniref:ZP domain-containing protein n=1 Tax=Knipowitschia caucasica TaxID=637954 RepID=A0AAV2LUI3_KNICA